MNILEHYIKNNRHQSLIFPGTLMQKCYEGAVNAAELRYKRRCNVAIRKYVKDAERAGEKVSFNPDPNECIVGLCYSTYETEIQTAHSDFWNAKVRASSTYQKYKNSLIKRLEQNNA